MIIFWKGKQMTENNIEPKEEHTCGCGCGCECCHCKKIFMAMVVLILVFIAGIMVGNCGSYRYADAYYADFYDIEEPNTYNSTVQVSKNRRPHKVKKFHRGAQEIPSPAPSIQQTGGFVDSAD